MTAKVTLHFIKFPPVVETFTSYFPFPITHYSNYLQNDNKNTEDYIIIYLSFRHSSQE